MASIGIIHAYSYQRTPHISNYLLYFIYHLLEYTLLEKYTKPFTLFLIRPFIINIP